MMQVMLQIPDSLPHQAMELAPREQFSLEQLMLSALSEKVSLMMTDDYLARRGSREKFQAVLAKIKSVEPEEVDRL